MIGADAPAIFAANGLADVGSIAQGKGLVGGLLLWGFGLWWLFLAVFIILRYFRKGVPFKLGWWGYTFPLGVYIPAKLKLGATLHFGAFTVLGSGLVLALTAMWAVVMARTLAGGWKGHFFVSPCIASAIERPLRVEALQKLAVALSNGGIHIHRFYSARVTAHFVHFWQSTGASGYGEKIFA